MHRIQVLSEKVANLIAAGEVVERPASVVKELLENSLDAGAGEIEVEAKNSGLSLLRVTDNGEGMGPEDARLALARHATSKLSAAEDLNHISTFGFRGEALPSIASVSRLELMTRPRDAAGGFFLKLEGGRVQEARETGCAPGTSITVRDLFFNTPARRKFLKSPATEQSHLIQAVESLALAFPGVRVLLTLDDREILNCPAAPSLRERVAAVYGRSLPQDLQAISWEGGGVWVKGLAAGPAAARPTRQGMQIYVNGRRVEHRGIAHALLEAYRSFLPPERYPVCFVFLTVPTPLVDVNVHPAKREVRFKDEHAIHDLVVSALRAAIGETDLSGARRLRAASGTETAASAQTNLNYPPAAPAWSGARVREAVSSYLSNRSGAEATETPGPGPGAAAEAFETEAAPEGDRIIGQVGRTYIAGQDGEGFFLLDQHALHERLLYEEIRRSPASIPRQALLLPLTFELPPAQSVLLEELRGEYARLGLEIEPFGKNTFVIRTQPHFWRGGDLPALVRETLDLGGETGRPPAAEALKDRVHKLLACHAAVKAGDRLQPEILQALVQGLRSLAKPWTCPHGRPFIFRLSWRELDRLFKRG